MAIPPSRPQHGPRTTKEEFTTWWLRHSGLTRAEFDAAGYQVVACGPSCADPACKGWRVTGPGEVTEEPIPF